jgi:hypothetical protein
VPNLTHHDGSAMERLLASSLHVPATTNVTSQMKRPHGIQADAYSPKVSP